MAHESSITDGRLRSHIIKKAFLLMAFLFSFTTNAHAGLFSNEWEDAGFSKQEAKEWKACRYVRGGGNVQAKEYSFGIFDDQNYGTYGNDARNWKKNGFAASEACEWASAGFDFLGAAKCRNAGLSPISARDFILKVGKRNGYLHKELIGTPMGEAILKGISFDEESDEESLESIDVLLEWKNAGYGLDEFFRWKEGFDRDGFGPHFDMKELLGWKLTGLTAEEVRKWHGVDRNPEKVKIFKDAGFTPADEQGYWLAVASTPCWEGLEDFSPAGTMVVPDSKKNDEDKNKLLEMCKAFHTYKELGIDPYKAREYLAAGVSAGEVSKMLHKGKEGQAKHRETGKKLLKQCKGDRLLSASEISNVHVQKGMCVSDKFSSFQFISASTGLFKIEVTTGFTPIGKSGVFHKDSLFFFIDAGREITGGIQGTFMLAGEYTYKTNAGTNTVPLLKYLDAFVKSDED